MLSRRFLSIFLLVSTAFVLPASLGQTPARPGQGDTFSSNTNADPCQQAYSQAIQKVLEHSAEVNAQWQRDVIDCKGNTGCVEQARQRRLAGERAVNKEKVDADKQRDVCRLRLSGNVSDTDPCQQAYSQAVEKALEHNTEVNAQWRRDVIDCKGNTGCVEQARQKRLAGEQAVNKEKVDADKQRDVCRGRLSGSVSGTGPGQGGRAQQPTQAKAPAKQPTQEKTPASQPTQPQPAPSPPPGPIPSPSPSTQYVCNLKDLAALVFKRYGTGKPIGIVKLGDRPNTYLVLLSGTEFGLGQTTEILDDVAAFQGNPALGSAYVRNILTALRSMVPANSHLIVAGHSLGGMVAQNLVTDREFAGNYTAERVITFGSPQTTPGEGPTQYLRIEAVGDPVTRLGPPQYFFHKAIVVDGKGLNSIENHLCYPESVGLGGYDTVGRFVPDFTKSEAYDLNTLQKYQRECLSLDMNSFREFSSPSSGEKW
jgi:hypothetical protein